MLSKEEFFARFSKILPGSEAARINTSINDLEIFFEPLSMAGLKEMHHYSKDERLYEFFEFEPFDTIEKTQAYIEKLEQRMAGDGFNKTAAYWFVRRKLDNYQVGTAALVSLDFGRQSIEWGFGVDPELWGHGYIFQIEEILKQYVFEVLELNRLYGITMVTNQRTISSLLASGMIQEGISRQFYCKNGAFIDGWRYAMLSKDYFESKKLLPSGNGIFTVSDVISIVQSVLTRDEITETSTMQTVSSWDSLSHMLIMIAVSETTSIKLSPSEIMRANSVKSLLDIIVKRVEAN
jgi:RimJ/RimL family protein N-acetyltransferase/acyl carrier protein